VSGGSYEYAYCGMESGGIARAANCIDFAIEDIAEALAAPAERTWDREAKAYRPLTAQEKHLTWLAIAGAQSHILEFQRLLKQASDKARELAPLFHELEWWRSCDRSVEGVQEFARTWALKLLEAKS
jgi:hypothetical protein